MSTREDVPTRRFARAAAQRERILAAAQQCFIERGFQGASMASIAEAADMSPGLMYRYFPSKNSIVLAIIERQLTDARTKIAELHASTDMVANLVRAFARWSAGDPQVLSVPLFLSISAEARRDPQIAQALRDSDRLTRADLAAWLSRPRSEGGRGIAVDTASSRALLMQCAIEGLAIRAIREPDLDVGTLGAALRELFDCLLAEPAAQRAARKAKR
jgi:AcrR family transcriptional regulator